MNSRNTILKPLVVARFHTKSPPRFELLPVARTRVYIKRNGRLLLVLLALLGSL
jgi:hypothetical protein